MTPASTRHTALVLAAAAVLSVVACGAPPRRPAPTTQATGSKLLTVPAIERMVQMGTPANVILGEMQKSGMVYNLTSQQMRDLRAVGMPAALISQMQATYQHAVRKNPKLASAGNYWTQVDGYWYGGLPFGWPREWVVGAPHVGTAKR
jgi:hypothetical protein